VWTGRLSAVSGVNYLIPIERGFDADGRAVERVVQCLHKVLCLLSLGAGWLVCWG
jgi:hypothetical protein